MLEGFLAILNACQKRKKLWKKVTSECRGKEIVEFGRFKVTAIELNDSKIGSLVCLNRLPQHSSLKSNAIESTNANNSKMRILGKKSLGQPEQ